MALFIVSIGTPLAPSRRYCYVLLSELVLPLPLVIFGKQELAPPYLCPSSVIKAIINLLDGFSGILSIGGCQMNW